jgi:1-acyl-sn-glycerol-3-phosphate acyltransferase
MRGRLRPWIRLAALLAVLLGGSIPLLLGLLLPGSLRVRWRRSLFRAWAGALAAVLHIRIELHGAPPRPPFLLVANHLSYVDVIVLASAVPGGIFIAKSEVRSWPFLGPICAGMGTLFVDRSSRSDMPRVLADMESALARGDGVIFFPEGTSTAGETVGPFRAPLLAPAARLERPVHAAALSYRTPPGVASPDLSVCWWGAMEFTSHLWNLLKVPRIEAALDFTGEPVVETDRKRLAERLHGAVLARFRPCRPVEVAKNAEPVASFISRPI